MTSFLQYKDSVHIISTETDSSNDEENHSEWIVCDGHQADQWVNEKETDFDNEHDPAEEVCRFGNPIHLIDRVDGLTDLNLFIFLLELIAGKVDIRTELIKPVRRFECRIEKAEPSRYNEHCKWYSHTKINEQRKEEEDEQERANTRAQNRTLDFRLSQCTRTLDYCNVS
jgi:hypothetical protein